MSFESHQKIEAFCHRLKLAGLDIVFDLPCADGQTVFDAIDAAVQRFLASHNVRCVPCPDVPSSAQHDGLSRIKHTSALWIPLQLHSKNNDPKIALHLVKGGSFSNPDIFSYDSLRKHFHYPVVNSPDLSIFIGVYSVHTLSVAWTHPNFPPQRRNGATFVAQLISSSGI